MQFCYLNGKIDTPKTLMKNGITFRRAFVPGIKHLIGRSCQQMELAMIVLNSGFYVLQNYWLCFFEQGLYQQFLAETQYSIKYTVI